MIQLWREIYYRISLAGGLIAMLLMTSSGFSGSMARFSDLFRPKEIFPAPVVLSCEEKMKTHPPLKAEKPSWCQAAADHQGLDKEKTENIF